MYFTLIISSHFFVNEAMTVLSPNRTIPEARCLNQSTLVFFATISALYEHQRVLQKSDQKEINIEVKASNGEKSRRRGQYGRLSHSNKQLFSIQQSTDLLRVKSELKIHQIYYDI